MRFVDLFAGLGGVRAYDHRDGRQAREPGNLPRRYGPNQPVPSRSVRDAAGGPSRRVLVVDEERGVREVLADLLRMQGYQVHMARNGRTALRSVTKRTYDLIVSDLRMQDMDGESLRHALLDLYGA